MENPILGGREGGKGPFQTQRAEWKSFREALRPTAPKGEFARAAMSPSLLGPLPLGGSFGIPDPPQSESSPP